MSEVVFADVSERQGPIDWPLYAEHHRSAGHDPIAVVRAYTGYRADRRFERNRAAFWRAAGGSHGALGLTAYLVADTGRPAAAQANAVCDLIGSLRRGEFVILDHEEGLGAQYSRAACWRLLVEARLRTTAWLYAGEQFYRQAQLERAGFGPERTIIAAYQPSRPQTLAHAVWQSSDAHGPMPGIAVPHDVNRFSRGAAELLALVGANP